MLLDLSVIFILIKCIFTRYLLFGPLCRVILTFLIPTFLVPFAWSFWPFLYPLFSPLCRVILASLMENAFSDLSCNHNYFSQKNNSPGWLKYQFSLIF